MPPPIRILAIDGGGVRGLSALYILRELMAQVRRQRRYTQSDAPMLDESEPVKPCQVFDLICGNSTGGLIALMLGRLEMVPSFSTQVADKKTVEEAIDQYRDLSEAVFSSVSPDSRAKFDHTVLEENIKKVIENSPLRLAANAPLRHDNAACRTFVTTTSLRAATGAVLLRSYGTLNDDPSPAEIWEAARATSAAATYFLPIRIDNTLYGDGGVISNNPSEEAIAEAFNIWPERSIGCLVSIGTGLEESLKVPTTQDTTTLARAIFGVVAPGYTYQLNMAEFCVKAVTSCEKTHRKLSQNPEKFADEGNYFRLNVPQSMSRIGLEEWQKIEDIIALAKDYMEDGDVKRTKQSIARIVLSGPVQS